MAYACLLCQINKGQEASVILIDLLSKDYKCNMVNMLLSIAYTMNGDSLMAEKYEAISNIAQLREQGCVANVGQSKEQNKPKASALSQMLKDTKASLASMGA